MLEKGFRSGIGAVAGVCVVGVFCVVFSVWMHGVCPAYAYGWHRKVPCLKGDGICLGWETMQ